MHHIFVEVGPCSLEATLERGHTAICFDPNLPLQNGLYGKVHYIEIWRGRGPHLLGPESIKVGLAPGLNPIGRVGGSTILLEDIG